MSERLAAISVDLDEARHYGEIHGLGPKWRGTHPIYDAALPRFEALFEELDIPATFFVIGEDTQRPENATTLKRLHAQGHELANHSYHHLYDLTRAPESLRRAEVDTGTRALRELTGAPPQGFRAPGYVINDALFDYLRAQGYRYDSSLFPCPSYYAAKVSALGAMRLRGRAGVSLVDTPRMLSASADPYHVGKPYWEHGQGILELPIGVTRAVTGRLPYIGTSLILAGVTGTKWLTRAIVGRPLVNLELHGIDLADAATDGLTELRPHQPDLRIPLERKLQVFRTAVAELRAADYRFVTLSDAAARFTAPAHAESTARTSDATAARPHH